MIVTMFDNVYEQAVRLANNISISMQRMATVENQIKCVAMLARQQGGR